MTAPSPPALPTPPAASPDDRLDSWKEIANYLKRDVTTVQRWEKREAMPVHRHVHDKIGSVYAFRSELDAWAKSRKVEEPERSHTPKPDGTPDPIVTPPMRRRQVPWLAVGAAILLLGGSFLTWRLASPGRPLESLLIGARFSKLTDYDGTEQAAALSRDGQFVAFLSDRDGRPDVWVGAVGTGPFNNLTKGAAPELVNPSVRNLGFSPDSTLVTFWARRFQESTASDINVWGIPVLGGSPKPYLEGVAEFDWSGDGTRLVYHTPGPGDPMFVRDTPDSPPRQIYSASPGLHAHFPIWSPDGRFIYFVQGTVPDRMDLWRITPDGGTPERITRHDARVSHPVFVDRRTLLYLASAADGGGPWIHGMDVDRRQSHRLSSGVERYTSLAASVDGRRVVATLSNPRSVLWRVPFADRVDISAGHRLALTTLSGSSPRFGPGSVLYVSSRGENDSIWKAEGNAASEIWSAPATRVTGAPAIAQDGQRIAFVAQRDRRTSLYVVNADGTNARLLIDSLDLHGAPTWRPDGTSITVAAAVNGTPRLFSVPLHGGPATQSVSEHALDPVWSSDGRLLVYSGPDIGTTFQVKAVTAEGQPAAIPKLTLSRGSRHLCIVDTKTGRALVVLRGEIGHKDLWLIDLATGQERQLSRFPADFNVRDFDVSPDGKEILLEQLQEQSDIVLIDLQRR